MTEKGCLLSIPEKKVDGRELVPNVIKSIIVIVVLEQSLQPEFVIVVESSDIKIPFKRCILKRVN